MQTEQGLGARVGRWWFAGGEPRLRLVDVSLIVCVAAILLAATWFAEAFFTERNVINLLRQVVANGLISLGMLLVILTGGIDLSVGSLVALGGVLFAGMTDQLGIGPALCIAIALRRARRDGERRDHRALQAAALHRHARDDGHRARLRLPLYRDPDLAVARGLSRAGRDPGRPDADEHDHHARLLRADLVLPQPHAGRAAPRWRSAATRRRCASPASTSARTIVLAYVLSGAFSALSGAILVSRLGIAQPSLGIAYELDAIAACVIGGAALGGGTRRRFRHAVRRVHARADQQPAEPGWA